MDLARRRKAVRVEMRVPIGGFEVETICVVWFDSPWYVDGDNWGYDACMIEMLHRETEELLATSVRGEPKYRAEWLVHAEQRITDLLQRFIEEKKRNA